MVDNHRKNNPSNKGRAHKHEWLRNRLKEVGTSQIKLASALSLPKGRITEIIKGDRAVQMHEIPIIANVTRLPIHDIIRKFVGENLHVTPELENTSVMVRGAVQAGEWKYATEEEPNDWEVITVPKALEYQRSYGLRVVGDSMDILYPEGSIIICVPYMDYTNRVGDGDHVVVERTNDTGQHEATVKELKINNDGEIWLVPKSTNPAFQAPIKLNHPSNSEEYFGSKDIRITGIVVGSVNMSPRISQTNSSRKYLNI